MLNLLILLTAVSANTLLALIILYKRRKSLDPSLLIFVLAIFFLLLWTVFNFLADNASTQSSALFWTRATFPASLLLVYFSAWFSFSFPKKIFNYSSIIWTFFLAVVFFTYASMSHYIIENVELIVGKGVSDVALGEYYPFIIALYLAMTGTIVFNFIAKYRRLKGKERMQIAYVILGWAAFISSALFTNLVLPYLTGNADWSKFGPLMSVIMVGTSTYAIVRYKFFDIRIIIQQGFIYTVLLILIASTYLGLSYLTGFIAQRAMNLQYILSAGITTIIGIFGIPVVKRYFDRLTDRFFFKDKYNFSDAVFALSEILNENISLDILEKEISVKLKGLLKTDTLNLYLKHEIKDHPVFKKMGSNLWTVFANRTQVFFAYEIEKLLDKVATRDQAKKLFLLKDYASENGLELFVILKVNKKIIGLLELGSKLSKESYTKDDLNLLKSLSYQMAVAIEKARLYREIKDYTVNLENKVNERTRKISELQQEQKQIILDISHGLQTPLTVIKGELGYLQKNIPESKSLLAFEKSVDRISKFISDLLLLAKLENMQDSFQKERINLSDLLTDLAEYFEIVLGNKKIKLASQIEDGVYISGNKEKLEEAVNSLVSNSIKYIGNGRSIMIGLRTEAGKALLTVKDDGIGIDKAELPMLAKRFYRAKNNANKGSGLGLSICKQIVDLHAGEMKIESDLGKGMEVTIALKTA